MSVDGVAALHVSDMDGTLLRGTTASREIALRHGSQAYLAVLERRFSTGEIDTRQFAEALHRLGGDLPRPAYTRSNGSA